MRQSPIVEAADAEESMSRTSEIVSMAFDALFLNKQYITVDNSYILLYTVYEQGKCSDIKLPYAQRQCENEV